MLHILKKTNTICLATTMCLQIACTSAVQGWAKLSSKGNVEITKVYIQKGYRLNERDDRSDTPLLWSARNGFPELVELSLKRGAPIDQKNESTGETPLILAAKNGHKAVAQLLLKEGADITIKDNIGKTAYVWATQSKHADIANLLKP